MAENSPSSTQKLNVAKKKGTTLTNPPSSSRPPFLSCYFFVCLFILVFVLVLVRPCGGLSDNAPIGSCIWMFGPSLMPPIGSCIGPSLCTVQEGWGGLTLMKEMCQLGVGLWNFTTPMPDPAFLSPFPSPSCANSQLLLQLRTCPPASHHTHPLPAMLVIEQPLKL